MAKPLPTVEVLGGTPDEAELSRLVLNYPTYEWEHRFALLRGYFEGRTREELVSAKLKALGKDVNFCSPLSKGGHSRWVGQKIHKTFVRLLYLRYRLDEGLTQVRANQKLLKRFGSDGASDAGQSAIRKITHSPVLDARVRPFAVP